MNYFKIKNHRILSVIGFSLPFAYLLSFPFEGQVLYSLLDFYGLNSTNFIFAAIIAHLAGLFSCGWLVKTSAAARNMMIGGVAVCLISTVPFFFAPSPLWIIGIVISGYSGGCLMASWGYFLKTFVPKDQRMKTCADLLICSNIIMIAIHMTALHISTFTGLVFSMLCLLAGIFFIRTLPVGKKEVWENITKSKRPGSLKKPLIMLCLFIFVITINSGLMYQVINPAFGHLEELASWYWALPYIIAIIVMRNLPLEVKRSRFLYLGMIMIMSSFIGFMLLGQQALAYIIVNTLMMGAFGIFDLFWWSILGGMLDYSQNPVKVFGVGLSANVAGILLGGVLGTGITIFQLPASEVAVIALVVLCVTLILLPTLNRQLSLLLKNHSYIEAYDHMTELQQEEIIQHTKVYEELTNREKEVLENILAGKSNRQIAKTLGVTESTVKTHSGNIYSKYHVNSRAEIISTLLKNRVNQNM